MIAQLTNHLWQSTFFAVAAGLLAAALRKNRAHVRFWLWFCASCKFFVPFSLLMSLGSQLPSAPAKTIATPTVSFAIVQIAQPFSDTLPQAPSTQSNRDWMPIAILGVWACGFSVLALIRFRAWLRIRKPVGQTIAVCGLSSYPIRSVPGLLEPGVIGIFRPILLLPAGIEERLTPRQLEAVLAHELCHIRRRDNLFASIHMLVEAVFWFHPLVWWIGARLVEERERACDEEVLRQGSEPHVYAAGILNVCKHYVESPLVCVSGVTGSDLKRRIEAIMANRIVLQLNFARKAALAATAVAALAVPIVVGILNAPHVRAQSAAGTPKFEVASIKPCKAGDPGGSPPGGRGPRTGKGNPKGGGGGPSPSPGRLITGCSTVAELIRSAYVSYEKGYLNRDPSNPPIEGGPAWIRSDRYQISAKAEGAPGEGTMRGPMMQALLEDRFQLKIHREIREVPVYALTVAKTGPKLPPFQEGSCTDIDLAKVTRPQPENACHAMIRGGKGSNLTLLAQGQNLGGFTKLLHLVVDRPVIDRTGIQGKFDIRLDFAAEETTPVFQHDLGLTAPPPEPSDEPAGPSIFAVVEKQLGLKLEPSQGLREFPVIEHVEKPTEN